MPEVGANADAWRREFGEDSHDVAGECGEFWPSRIFYKSFASIFWFSG